MNRLLQQLYYLLYKNFLFKWRNKRNTIMEVAAILYFVAILAVIRLTAPTLSFPTIQDSERLKFSISKLPVKSNSVGYVIKPDTVSIAKINKFIHQFRVSSNLTMYQFKTETELDDYYQNNAANFTIGIIFNFSINESFSYTIKTPYQAVPKESDSKISTSKTDCRALGYQSLYQNCPAATYLGVGFASVQSFIDLAYIQVFSNQTAYLNVDSMVQMFPKHSYEDPVAYLKSVVGIYMVIAFSPYVLYLLTYVVAEKEKKIKESMKIMGLNMAMFWLSWFITYGIIILVGCILTVVISAAVSLYGSSNYLIIFIILYLYGLSIITLSFTLTPLFTKARNAGSAGSFATMLLSLISLIHTSFHTSNTVKWITCFLSPVALSLGLQSGLDFHDPLTWSNITTKGDFPAINVIVMLLIDTFLYLLIAGYLDAVFPGEYGKAQHPLFIFTLSFWKKIFKKQNMNSLQHHTSLINSTDYICDVNVDVEDVSPELNMNKVISVENLLKVFSQGKKKPDIRAVDGVSFNVYEGQITALLGHNGAGKSTLFSILTGMLTPSSGAAELYGLNIRSSDDMDKIRNIIGLCPQQNIIFDQLTPVEHLKMFGGIKGIDTKKLNELVEKLITEIGLKDRSNIIAKNLSGGQKRKLCVGIALIGDPKIVFLDEPTSGMDPSSRRQIWSLLQSKREDRVIFLTTHFMDEADILADYKIIMSNGKIRCAGSSLFLKSRFGIGYHLGMVVNDDANASAIQQMVTEKIPGAQLSRQHGKELAFSLPLCEVDKFSSLFEHFEKLNTTGDIFSVDTLGIASYGVSMTTLEEVFLKLEENNEVENDGHENSSEVECNDAELNVNRSSNNECTNTTLEQNGGTNNVIRRRNVSMWLHLFALLEVRFWLSVRSPLKMIFQAVIPAILMIVGLILARGATTPTNASDNNILKLDPSLYLKTMGSGAENMFDVLYKVERTKDTNYTVAAFSTINFVVEKVDKLDLLEKAPHTLAYEINNIQSNGKIQYNLRYNDSAIHSVPVGINAISNVMYKEILAKQGKKLGRSKLPITVYSKQFVSTKPEWKYDSSSLFSSMLIGLAMAGMMGAFSIEAVMYRQLGIRHQLRVSGLNRIMYWLHFVLGDMIFFIFPIITMYIGIVAFNIASLYLSSAMFCLLILTILYIPACLMYTYTWSFLFSNWESAQSAMPTIVNMLALAPYFVVALIDMTSGQIAGKPLHAKLAIGLSFIDPPFTLLCGLYYISRIYRVESILQQKNNINSISLSKYFEWKQDNPLPALFIIMFCHLLICTWATYAIDCYKSGGTLIFPLSFIKRLQSKKMKKKIRTSAHSSSTRCCNDDVMRERERVKRAVLDDKKFDTAVLTQGIKKQFNDKVVVKDVNLLVERGEIFGILGPNGAGKTTVLNMITADLNLDGGQVFVNGYNIVFDLAKAFESLGYCPQFDALYTDLTLREHLKLYGLIKGVAYKDIQFIITRYAEALKITEHLDKRSKDLSGGTKRKLSFLISMIGSSSILIMDEPSCGMDPSSRRFLWSAISSNIVGSKGAMLTTHSMEEAEALCARVGIVVQGELKCVGTTQELKTNYGSGYQLEIKFKVSQGESQEEAKSRINEYVLEIFPVAEELESFGTRITYKIRIDQVKSLSTVFSALQQGKATVNIEEYSFSQSTLEQVFLEFAKEQDVEQNGEEIYGEEVLSSST